MRQGFVQLLLNLAQSTPLGRSGLGLMFKAQTQFRVDKLGLIGSLQNITIGRYQVRSLAEKSFNLKILIRRNVVPAGKSERHEFASMMRSLHCCDETFHSSLFSPFSIQL